MANDAETKTGGSVPDTGTAADGDLTLADILSVKSAMIAEQNGNEARHMRHSLTLAVLTADPMISDQRLRQRVVGLEEFIREAGQETS